MEKSKESIERISAFLLYVAVLQPYTELRNGSLSTGSLLELPEYWMYFFRFSEVTAHYMSSITQIMKVLLNICEMRLWEWP